jgi:hypothetical protein
VLGSIEDWLMKLFSFHAELVWYDEVSLCISFADKATEHEHYFTIQRSEPLDELAIDTSNVYIELDDQCWGGYGGIERVSLERTGFTLILGFGKGPDLHGSDGVWITFDLPNEEFQVLCRVLQKLLREYDSLLRIIA